MLQPGDKTAELRQQVTRGIGNWVLIFTPCEEDKFKFIVSPSKVGLRTDKTEDMLLMMPAL